MAKPGKRQMIILGVMGIAVLYAAFDFLAPKKRSSAPDRAQKTAELSTFVTDLAAGLGKDTTKNLNTLIFSRAEKEWAQDPFLDAKSYRAWSAARAPAKKEGAGAAAPKSEFVYSGYLDTGRKRMAIINGIEYSEGENLDVKGYALKSVSATKVVIENRGTGATVTVPLLE
jgi:type II secretory pathway component PulC